MFLTSFNLAAPAAGDNPYAAYSNLIFIIIMFAIFYFLLIRPQQKRAKQRQAMLNSLQKGDKVVTIGGIHGTIDQINDETIVLKVNETTRITIDRQAVNNVKKD